MKAIETRYRGYRFRSRLEARWAVFFDTLCLPWEYESAGFHLPSRQYLPDFYLPSIRAYAEVKPLDELLDRQLSRELALATGHLVLGLVGTPAITWYRYFSPYLAEILTDPEVFEDHATEEPTDGVVTDWMHWDDPTRGWPVHCEFRGHKPLDDPGFGTAWLRAVAASRSARFEFGESGPA